MGIDGRAFWLRVDDRLANAGRSLADLCSSINVSYFTVNTQRKNHKLPKVEQLLMMSRELGMTMEELVTGDGADMCPEARIVIDDEDVRLVVRAIMYNRELLPLMAALVRSGQKMDGVEQHSTGGMT